MSILLKHISKQFGAQKALDDISFDVKKGDVVGFLGPNGAGKSTTMKIITGYIPANSGQALVNGLDVEANPLEIKRNIGYLPENNPLYYDMYVKEYLGFVAKIHQLDQIPQKVKQVIEQVGLGLEQNKLIGSLSKGYKQRVGLAQAIIHNPSVLVLDEPTSGLDPNQIIEIRQLIQALGREKTILMSTHIMQEVEAICDRIIIINKGKIVADDRKDMVKSTMGQKTVLFVEFSAEIVPAELKKYLSIQDVVSKGNRQYLLVSNTAQDIREKVFQYAVEQKISVLEIRRESHDLEEIFKTLTNTSSI